MKVTTIGRKVSLKDNFLQRVEDRLGKLDKFFSENAEATVTVTVELLKTPIEGSVSSSIGVKLEAMPVEPGKEGTSEGIKDSDQNPVLLLQSLRHIISHSLLNNMLQYP